MSRWAPLTGLAPIGARGAFAAGMELQALLTVARRLDRDRVVFLITSRPGPRADGWERFCL